MLPTGAEYRVSHISPISPIRLSICLFFFPDVTLAFAFRQQMLSDTEKGSTCRAHWQNKLIFSPPPTVIIAADRDYGKANSTRLLAEAASSEGH